MHDYRNAPNPEHAPPEPYAYDDRVDAYMVRRGWESGRAGTWIGRDEWTWPESRELPHPTVVTLDGYGIQVQGASSADVADDDTSTRFRVDDLAGLRDQIERIESLHKQPSATTGPAPSWV